MGAEFGIVYALWDYAADNGELLDLVAGQVGVDRATVPVVTGAGSQFRLGISTDQPHFRTAGGWHFSPTARMYAAIGVRPCRAAWVGSADVLGRLRDHLARLGIRLVLRIDMRPVPALVEEQPHLVQRNAWGQELPQRGACACNPHLRELLRATLIDLQRYEPAGYELVHWMPDHACDPPADRPLAWQPEARKLLETCFCPACRQIAERAGVDPEQAARSVRASVGQLVSSPSPQPRDLADPVLDAYRAARVSDCATWLRRLAVGDAARCYQSCRAMDAPAPYEYPPLEEILRLPHDALRRSEAEGADVLVRQAAVTGIVGWSQPVWRPAFSTAAGLVRLVTEATRAGLRIIEFEGLGEAAGEAVTWLKQAVRFARRG